jgi:hypothetical protein
MSDDNLNLSDLTKLDERINAQPFTGSTDVDLLNWGQKTWDRISTEAESKDLVSTDGLREHAFVYVKSKIQSIADSKGWTAASTITK